MGNVHARPGGLRADVGRDDARRSGPGAHDRRHRAPRGAARRHTLLAAVRRALAPALRHRPLEEPPVAGAHAEGARSLDDASRRESFLRPGQEAKSSTFRRTISAWPRASPRWRGTSAAEGPRRARLAARPRRASSSPPGRSTPTTRCRPDATTATRTSTSRYVWEAAQIAGRKDLLDALRPSHPPTDAPLVGPRGRRRLWLPMGPQPRDRQLPRHARDRRLPRAAPRIPSRPSRPARGAPITRRGAT